VPDGERAALVREDVLLGAREHPDGLVELRRERVVNHGCIDGLPVGRLPGL
jgi:hypothetical protein